MMEPNNYIRLAKYHNGRLVRMKLCAASVETCAHRKAFLAIAEQCGEARDWCVRAVRHQLQKQKQYKFLFESLDFEGRYYGEFTGIDALGASMAFERQCEDIGVDPGMYRAVLIGRARL